MERNPAQHRRVEKKVALLHVGRRRFLRIGVAACAGAYGYAHSIPRAVGQNSSKRLVDHIVVLLRENHSYDNYFGTYPGGNGKTAGPRCEDERSDPPHLREHALRDVAVDARGYCHYQKDDIPNYFAYAREFVLCDNYFADIRGPSYPNYFMLMAAQTPTLDHIRGETRGQYDLPTIADRLTEKGVPWRNYDDGIRLVTMFKRPLASGNVRVLSQFAADAATGDLPAVSWLTPNIAESEHPPHSVRRGENWTVRHVNAVMRSPLWPKAMILVVWDEWGGFWDHVKPRVEQKEKGLFGQPIRDGYRVPCVVIGPYAKRGHISHSLYSHLSVLRTIEKVFEVSPLNDLDAAANDMLDCFDFDQEPRQPLILEERKP